MGDTASLRSGKPYANPAAVRSGKPSSAKSRATRLYADIPVEVRLPAKGEFRRTGRVRNLNTTGLLVEYTNPLRAGESIGLEFPPTRERGRMVVLGEVAWADDKRAGVRLCGMMPHHRARFEKLLTTLQGGQTLLG